MTLDENFLLAVGHPTRLTALAYFEQQPGTARELADHLAVPQTRLTTHIRMLADNDLIFAETRRKVRGLEANVWRSRTNGWVAIAQLLTDAGTRSAEDAVRFPAWPTDDRAPAPGGDLGDRLEPPARGEGSDEEDDSDAGDGPPQEG